MDLYSFSFSGYQNFDPIAEHLEKLYEKTFGFDNYDYRIAVTEAVCNAARYSLQGLMEADIQIIVKISPVSISTSVLARTHPFDVLSYRKRLLSLLETDAATKDWGDYLGGEDASRGIWYMLTGCDYVYYDFRGQSVTLFAYLSEQGKQEPRPTQIGLLLPRFYVKENGVIV